MGVAALVLGIVSIVLGVFSAGALGWVGGIVGIVGIILGALGRKTPKWAKPVLLQPVWYAQSLVPFLA